MRDSWAQRTTWTEADRETFYERLRRARKANRASYLYLQARALAESDWPGGNAIGLALLDAAAIEGVPDLQAAAYHQLRAECFFRAGDNAAALKAYDESFAAQERVPNVRIDLEISFAWEVATRRLKESYEVALARLAPVPKEPMTLAWPANRYRYFGALALISDSLGDVDGARRWATNALNAAAQTEGPFLRHKDLGLVETPESGAYNELLRLAAA